VCLKLGPLLFIEFASLSHRKMYTSASGEKSPACVVALQGFKRSVEVMTSIDHPMKPSQRLASLLLSSLETAGDLKEEWRLKADVEGALKKAKEGEERRGETFTNWEQRIIHFMNILIQPVDLDLENDEQYYFGGLLPELIGNNMVDEAILLLEVIGISGALVTDLGERRRLGERVVSPWSNLNHAFKGPLLLGLGGFTSIGESSGLATMGPCISTAVNLCGGMDGDTRLVSYEKTDPICSDEEGLEEIRRGEGFSTGFGGFWDGMAQNIGDSFPLGCVGVAAASLMETLGIGGNFEDMAIMEEFPSKDKLMDCVDVGSGDGKVMGSICKVSGGMSVGRSGGRSGV